MAAFAKRLLSRVARDDLLRHGGLLSVATVIGALLLLVFNVYMARELGPEVFGVLGALLAINAVVSQVGNGVQLTVAREVSLHNAAGNHGQVGSVLATSAWLLLLAALGVAGALAAFSPLLSDFLNVSSALPVILLGIANIFYLVLPAFNGALQGLQKFTALTINRVGERLVLLVAALALVALGFGITGVMIALSIAGAVLLIQAALPLRGYRVRGTGFRVWGKNTLYPVPRTLYPVLVTVLCLAVLSNIDIVAAQRFLSPKDAGLYSAIARTGKVVFFISLAFSRALFPKASHAQAVGEVPWWLMARSLAYIGIFCAVCVLGAALFAKPAMHLIYGGPYSEKALLLPWYVAAVSLLSVSTVMIYYNMSISSHRYMVPLVGALALQLLLLALLHAKPFHIVLDLTLSLGFLFAAMVALQFLWTPRMGLTRAHASPSIAGED
jgi:O-antigen/teichoic acid export membrane protein